MSARRGHVLLVALLCTVVVSACASKVSGSGSFARTTSAASGQPEGGSGTGPSQAAGGQGPGSATPSGEPSKDLPGICALWTAAELETVFGEPVQVAQGIASVSCEFETETAGMSVSVYDYLSMEEEASITGEGEASTVQGLPAWESEGEILVARTEDPAEEGLIVVSHYYPAEQGTQIGRKLLEKVVPRYRK